MKTLSYEHILALPPNVRRAIGYLLVGLDSRMEDGSTDLVGLRNSVFLALRALDIELPNRCMQPGQRTLRSVPGEFSFENEDDT